MEGSDPPACTFHNPLIDPEVRRAKKAQGGYANATPSWVKTTTEAGIDLETIISLVSETVENIRSMSQTPHAANSMIAAVRLLDDIRWESQYAEKAEELRKQLEELRGYGTQR